MRLWGCGELYYSKQKARAMGFWVLHKITSAVCVTYFSDLPGEHREYTQASLDGQWEI